MVFLKPDKKKFTEEEFELQLEICEIQNRGRLRVGLLIVIGSASLSAILQTILIKFIL